jgi:hypothetical protein
MVGLQPDKESLPQLDGNLDHFLSFTLGDLSRATIHHGMSCIAEVFEGNDEPRFQAHG